MRTSTRRTSRGLLLATAGALALSGLAPATALAAPQSYSPDFGPNVKIFDPSTPVDQINAYLQSISDANPDTGQFSTDRHLVLFRPGTYGSASHPIDSQVGYYTEIAGLGASPQDVVINGALHVDPHPPSARLPIPNSLDNFWRSLGNLTINPIQAGEPAHTMSWAVSQATPLRRVNINGNLDLIGPGGSVAFGSEIADSRISGTVSSGNAQAGQFAQAQYYTHDSSIGGWNGTGVNLVFAGVHGAPASNFDPNGITTLPSTPVSRPAPFLYLDGGTTKVFVPSADTHTAGVDWSTRGRAGQSVPIQRFYVAKPTDTAATLNGALASGKNLLLTPGVYALDAPLRVTRPGTVVLGLGFATVSPTRGTAALEVGNAPGIVVSGLIVDGGPRRSDVLVQVGTPGGRGGHGSANDPTTLSDLFIRVGGATAGVATTGVRIDTDHVLLDDSWIWRADHGAGSEWIPGIDHGLIVNGDDVTATGLFVEHWLKEQVVWNGQRGQTVFYQSEMPENMPNQAAWMNGTSDGYASYTVGAGVCTHQATGLAIYALFPFPPTEPVHAATAITAPTAPQVRFTSMVTGVVRGQGGIRHIINNTGDAVDASTPNHVDGMIAVARLASYPVR